MIPLMLELNEPLKDGEEMVGIKSMVLEKNGGHCITGYVAVIRNFKSRYSNDVRYGSLRGVEYNKKKFSNVV